MIGKPLNMLITIKCHNRPMYLYRCLKTLSECRNIGDYEVVVSCDNPDLIMQEQMKEALWEAGLKNSKLVVHDRKLGCWGNKKWCLEEAFERNDYKYCLHLEEDILSAKPLLEYCKQVGPLLDEYNYFAACFMHRPCHDSIYTPYNRLVQKKYFEISGGFMISSKQWNRIKEMGGGFAVNYVSEKGRTYNCQGEEWLKEINKCEIGGSGYPWDKYFRENKYCLYPKLGLTKNIGILGEHLKNPETHSKIQGNDEWLGNSFWWDEARKPVFYNLDNIETDDRKFVEYGIEK